MRKGLALWSAMLFLAAPSAAQDAPGDAWSSAPAPGSSFSLLAPASAPAARSSRPGPFERYSWQLGFGYSFVRFNQAFTGQSVSLNGINTSIAHYFNDWMAIEGEAAPTFGSTGGVGSKFLFYGAGVRIADRSGGRIEPWAHRAVGACDPGRGQILSARGERYGQRRVRSGRRRGLANHAAILFSHTRRLAGNAFVQHYPERPQNRRGVRVQLLAAASASYAAGGRARVSEGNIHHA